MISKNPFKILNRRRPFWRSAKAEQLEIVSGTHPCILNYGANSSNKQRAILSYLVQPVIDELKDGKTAKFSNDGIARTWPKVLEGLGYSVDIINWDDKTYKSGQSYDLVVGHGGINFQHLCKQFANVPYIYFSTGSYWQFHNKQEEARFAYFKQRHGLELPSDRYITTPEEESNKAAIGIIALGNSEVAKTYAKFPNVVNIPVACYPDNRYQQVVHNFSINQKNFLFFSGAGNVHKGLDLLIDVFKELPDYNLHICTFIDKEFGEFFREDLELPNIFLHGFVELRSAAFYEIIDNCNFVIFPSCSEGSPGSVVECMMQGLIPIVSKEAHLDVGSAGVVLPDCTLANIKTTVESIAAEPLPSLKKRSREAHKIATTTHAPESFSANLGKAIRHILDKQK